ncbi:hypothetical protein GCM10018966_072980 [Streptomyces yanii]
MRRPKRERTQTRLHHPVQGVRIGSVGEERNLTPTELVAVNLTDTSGLDCGPHGPFGFEDQGPLIRFAEVIATELEASDHGVLGGVAPVRRRVHPAWQHHPTRL